MRRVILVMLTGCCCACTWHEAVDPLDATIELTGIDSVQVDWREIGPIGIGSQERFVWTCGTFDRTPKEWAAFDSLAAVIRSKGGVICY
jgi:hypothetical protein